MNNHKITVTISIPKDHPKIHEFEFSVALIAENISKSAGANLSYSFHHEIINSQIIEHYRAVCFVLEYFNDDNEETKTKCLAQEIRKMVELYNLKAHNIYIVKQKNYETLNSRMDSLNWINSFDKMIFRGRKHDVDFLSSI